MLGRRELRAEIRCAWAWRDAASAPIFPRLNSRPRRTASVSVSVMEPPAAPGSSALEEYEPCTLTCVLSVFTLEFIAGVADCCSDAPPC